MNQLSILLVFGGESSEHDVSIMSAKNVYTAMDKQKYNITLCYIDRDGRWWKLEDWSDAPDTVRSVQLVAAPGTKSFLTVPGSQVIPIDSIFPVLHGKMGEDGTIQGLAAMAHIPVVGCDVESSVLSMNKDTTKRIADGAGVPVVPWIVTRAGESEKSLKKRATELDKHGPWFVKPARAGSSLGVFKVSDVKDLKQAVDQALEHDQLILIEKAVTGRELEVSILGNPPHHKASGVGEIIPGSEFYDYDDKYSSNSTSETRLDAKLPNALTKVIRQHAFDVYESLGCTGLARVDFLLSDDLTPYMNEINTMPGFTDISMYPKLWEHKKIPQSELIDKLIALSIE